MPSAGTTKPRALTLAEIRTEAIARINERRHRAGLVEPWAADHFAAIARAYEPTAEERRDWEVYSALVKALRQAVALAGGRRGVFWTVEERIGSLWAVLVGDFVATLDDRARTWIDEASRRGDRAHPKGARWTPRRRLAMHWLTIGVPWSKRAPSATDLALLSLAMLDDVDLGARDSFAVVLTREREAMKKEVRRLSAHLRAGTLEPT